MSSTFERFRLDGPEVARFFYYMGNGLSCLVPDCFYRSRRAAVVSALQACEEIVHERAQYYNGLDAPFRVPDAVTPFQLHLSAGRTAYQFDLHAGMRYFPKAWRVDRCLGDNRLIPSTPAVVKSRPIAVDNQNAVLLNLNKVRHFYFVRDATCFSAKEDRVVWRGRACQQHRKDFLARYYAHPLCDVGHYHSRHQDVVWTKPQLSIREQLCYKYILAIEGNDVATNLKWVLSSQSLCFMTKPHFETWFMEGRLVAGVHYVELREDYADLEEKICYYNRHTDEAEDMIRAANAWVAQFRDPMRERLITMLVLWRYFYLSGQAEMPPPALGAGALLL